MRKYDAWRYAKMRRWGMARIELVVVGITLLFAGLLILALGYMGREEARRSQCASHLRAIGFATDNYYDSYLVFPLGVGTKGESCLLPLLPFLGEPMDEPLATYGHVNKISANDTFFYRDRSWLRCPCELVLVTDETRMSTSYHGCAGDRIESFSTTELESEEWTARNVFGQCDDSTKLRWYTHESVSDGLYNTVAFAESRIATGRAATHREDNTSLFTDWNATTTEAIPSRCMANSETFDVSIQTAMNHALGAMGTMCGDEIVGLPETPRQTDETLDYEPTSVETRTEDNVENVGSVEDMENIHSSSDGSL